MRKRVNSPPFISFVSLPGKAGVHSKQTIALCLLIASLHFAYFSGAGGLLLRTSLLGKFQFRDPVHVALSRQTASSPSAGGVREASQMSVGHSYMSAGEKSHMSVGKEYAHQVTNGVHHYLAISSDDWGRWVDNDVPIWRDRLSQQLLRSNGAKLPEGPFSQNSAETETDILSLFDMISTLNHNVSNRESVVLSPFWVVGGPDYASMAASGCPDGPDCKYRELLISRSAGGLNAPNYKRGDLRKRYKEGFRHRMWYPQYHGRSHLNHDGWTRSLNSDTNAQRYFKEGLATANQAEVPRGEYANFQDVDELTKWIEGGVRSFVDFWGFKPTITLEPNHVCTPDLPTAFKRAGFTGIDSCYCVLPSTSNNLGKEMQKIERDTEGSVVHVPPTMRYYGDYSFSQGLECIDPRISIDAYKGTLIDFEKDVRPILDQAFKPAQDGFAALSWHQQNMLASTYTADFQIALRRNFVSIIREIRRLYPFVEFVTSSELHQLHSRGWSMLVWSDRIVYRNGLKAPLMINVPDIHKHYAYAKWEPTTELQLLQVPADGSVGSSRLIQEVHVGDRVELAADTSYIIMRTHPRQDTFTASGSRHAKMEQAIVFPVIMAILPLISRLATS